MRALQAGHIGRMLTSTLVVAGIGGLVWGVSAAFATRPPASVGWTAYELPARPGATPLPLDASTSTSSATATARGTPPRAAASAASTASAPAPVDAAQREAFAARCVQPLRERDYAAALRQCASYLDHPGLGGAAHAAMAAAYSAPGRVDLQASARHAEAAAALGDARGKFMAAVHMLAGQTTQPFALDQVHTWLTDAASASVPHAAQLLSRVQESVSCRSAPAFTLLDAPVFCLFRGELQQRLRERGMTPADLTADAAWSDLWQPGGALAGASVAQVDYDREPEDELLRPARLVYRFEPAVAAQRLPQLLQALQRKYGAPHGGRLSAAPGASARWELAGGVELRLSTAADGRLDIEYRHAQRWAARLQHLAQAERAQELARIMQDQAAL